MIEEAIDTLVKEWVRASRATSGSSRRNHVSDHIRVLGVEISTKLIEHIRKKDAEIWRPLVEYVQRPFVEARTIFSQDFVLVQYLRHQCSGRVTGAAIERDGSYLTHIVGRGVLPEIKSREREHEIRITSDGRPIRAELLDIGIKELNDRLSRRGGATVPLVVRENSKKILAGFVEVAVACYREESGKTRARLFDDKYLTLTFRDAMNAFPYDYFRELLARNEMPEKNIPGVLDLTCPALPKYTK